MGEKKVDAARGEKGCGRHRDFLLVGQDDLGELSEVNGDFFQAVLPLLYQNDKHARAYRLLIVVEIVLDFGDHVDAAEDWRDVAGKVDAVVARHVEKVAFAHDVVLGHVARAQHVVEVDLDERLRLVLMDEVDFFLGRVAREAFGRADGVDDGVGFLKLNGTGLLDLAKDVDARAAELRDVDGNVGRDDVARESVGQDVRELADGHALGVNLTDERKGNIPIGTHGKRRLVRRGIAEVLLLRHDDVELVAGAQQIILGVECGRSLGARRRGLYLLDDVGLFELFLLFGLLGLGRLGCGCLRSLSCLNRLNWLRGLGRGHIGGNAARVLVGI